MFNAALACSESAFTAAHISMDARRRDVSKIMPCALPREKRSNQRLQQTRHKGTASERAVRGTKARQLESARGRGRGGRRGRRRGRGGGLYRKHLRSVTLDVNNGGYCSETRGNLRTYEWAESNKGAEPMSP